MLSFCVFVQPQKRLYWSPMTWCWMGTVQLVWPWTGHNTWCLISGRNQLLSMLHWNLVLLWAAVRRKWVHRVNERNRESTSFSFSYSCHKYLCFQMIYQTNNDTNCQGLFESCELVGRKGDMSAECHYRCHCSSIECQLIMMDNKEEPIRICEADFFYL